MSPLDEKFEQSRVSAVTVLAGLIDGKIGTLIAARKLVSLRHTLVGDKLDDDWCAFVGIDSETDHLPTGEERKHWAADALAAKDVEIQKAEDFYRARALDAARNLMHRYKEPIQLITDNSGELTLPSVSD